MERHLPLRLIPLCKKGDRVGIERQLADGADIQEGDVEGNSPLHVAAEAPRNEIATIQTLIENGANLNACNYMGACPLHYVCLRKSNWRGVANVLLENGAEINCQTLAGKTPLHFAAERDMPELVEVLLLSGADVGIADAEGNLPQHLVLQREGGRDTVKRQILEYLVQYEANLMIANLETFTPMLLACRSGYVRCLQFLCERGSHMQASTCRREMGLHLACAHGHPETAQFMLQVFPGGLEFTDVEGNTALHRSAAIGNVECALLLLKAGAKPTVKNNARQTAMDMAKGSRGSAMADLGSAAAHNPELLNALNEYKGKDGCRPM